MRPGGQRIVNGLDLISVDVVNHGYRKGACKNASRLYPIRKGREAKFFLGGRCRCRDLICLQWDCGLIGRIRGCGICIRRLRRCCNRNLINHSPSHLLLACSFLLICGFASTCSCLSRRRRLGRGKRRRPVAEGDVEGVVCKCKRSASGLVQSHIGNASFAVFETSHPVAERCPVVSL